MPNPAPESNRRSLLRSLLALPLLPFLPKEVVSAAPPPPGGLTPNGPYRLYCVRGDEPFTVDQEIRGDDAGWTVLDTGRKGRPWFEEPCDIYIDDIHINGSL
jgi:hypothetical protein